MAMEAVSSIKVSYSEPVRTVQKSEAKIPETQNAELSVSANSNETRVVKVQANSRENDNFSKEDEKSNSQRIKSAISNANSMMKKSKTKCEFSYHEATNRVSIKVIDKDTEEVIREIPPEETLEMIEKMWELAGIMVDEKR